MRDLMLVVMLLGLPTLLVGLIKPKWLGGNRWRAATIGLVMMVGGFVGFGVLTDRDSRPVEPPASASPPSGASDGVPLPPQAARSESAPAPPVGTTQPASPTPPPPPSQSAAVAPPTPPQPPPTATTPPAPLQAHSAGAGEAQRARGFGLSLADFQTRFNDVSRKLNLPARAVEMSCSNGGPTTLCSYALGQTLSALATA